jgi:molecular chaperone Hsp33
MHMLPFANLDPSLLRTEFVRTRNVLLIDGDLGPLLTEYRRHAEMNGIELEGQVAEMFLDGLAIFALHCASKPRRQHFAWTLSFQDPRANFFYAADTSDGTVTGRFFTENVAEQEENSFWQEFADGKGNNFRSYVTFPGNTIFSAVEHYYLQSEQRPARFFKLSPSRYVILAAHPDWDENWFYGVRDEELFTLSDKETIAGIETRPIFFYCGCSEQKLMSLLAGVFLEKPEDLFEGTDILTANCPRCGARYRITREALEAYCANHQTT